MSAERKSKVNRMWQPYITRPPYARSFAITLQKTRMQRKHPTVVGRILTVPAGVRKRTRFTFPFVYETVYRRSDRRYFITRKYGKRKGVAE